MRLVNLLNIFDHIKQLLECGISKLAQRRILGGLDAGYGQFPWAAIITITGTVVEP